MKYYKVKPEFDNKRICHCIRGKYTDIDILIGKELYTEKEFLRLVKTHVFGVDPKSCFELVEIPKNKTYWLFGARFSFQGY